VSQEVVESLRTHRLDVLSGPRCRHVGYRGSRTDAVCCLESPGPGHASSGDFEREHHTFLEQGLKHFGIIIAKRRFPTSLVVAKLLELLDNVTAEDLENQLRYI
jgi:hypothetical protein